MHKPRTELPTSMVNNKNSPKKNVGATLIEILISMFIFSLVMAGLVGLFGGTKAQFYHFHHRMVSAELGSVFLDPLLQDVRADEWTPNGNCLMGATAVCPGVEYINYTNYTPNWADAGTFSNVSCGATGIVRKVRLRISWPEPLP